MREREIVVQLRLPALPRRRWLVGGMAAILCFGAIVYAAVPNIFSSGDPFSSAKLNANFSSLDSRVSSLEGKQLTGPGLGFCASASTTCNGAACAGGQRAIAGGCSPDSPVAIVGSYPSGGAPGSFWVCKYASAVTSSIWWECGP